MNVLNSTFFAADIAVLPDDRGAETLLIIVKGTWKIVDKDRLEPAQEQVPVSYEPAYSGEPGASTLLHDTDIVLYKPRTDCILLGHAYGRGAGETDVTFAVGPIRKTLHVFGERIWMKCLGKKMMSKPVPFNKIPLVWERSFGGRDSSHPDPKHHQICAENPVGRGFLAVKSQREIDGMRLPNIENPRNLIKSLHDRPVPSAFAPIAREWLPRASYAGTCDDAWRKNQFPLPPLDLNPKFYCSAPADQISPTFLQGNERVVVIGACETGTLRFDLPDVRPKVTVRVANDEHDLAMALDTVVIEPDEDRVVLTWRGRICVHGKMHIIGTVKII